MHIVPLHCHGIAQEPKTDTRDNDAIVFLQAGAKSEFEPKTVWPKGAGAVPCEK